MKVAVKLFATLAIYLPRDGGGESATIDVPEGTTAGHVVHRLGIPDAAPRVMLVNGRDADPGEPLRDGDALTLFPPLAGGL